MQGRHSGVCVKISPTSAQAKLSYTAAKILDLTLCNDWATKISAKNNAKTGTDSDARRKPGWTARSDIEAGEGRQAEDIDLCRPD